MAADRSGSVSGLTAEEARTFHGFFMSSTIAYIAIAVVAHILVWLWRPWFPSETGYSSLIEGAKAALTLIG